MIKGKASFNNNLVRDVTGQLADEAKWEEYERLMRQKRTPPAEADEVPTQL